MSQPVYKAPRSIQAVQNEFTNLCTKVGELEFRKTTIEKDLGLYNDRLQELQLEFVAAQQAQAEVEAKAKADAEAKAQKAKEWADAVAETKAVSDRVHAEKAEQDGGKAE